MGIFDFFKRLKERKHLFLEKTQKSEDSKIALKKSNPSLDKERIKEINKKLLAGGEEELKKLRIKYPLEDDKEPLLLNYPTLEKMLGDLTNKVLVQIVKDIKLQDNKFLNNSFKNRNFNSKKEVEDFLKENIISFLLDKLTDLKERISELNKKGYDLKLEGLISLRIPLKIKQLKAEFKLKNYDKIKMLFEKVEKVVVENEKDLQKKLKLKEKN